MRRPPSSGPHDGSLAHIDGDGIATFETTAHIDTESLLSPPRYLSGRPFPQTTRPKLKIVFLGPRLTGRGGGDAAIYRGLLRELSVRGHDVLLLECGPKDVGARRRPQPTTGRTEHYSDINDLKDRFAGEVRGADFVMVGSALREEMAVGEWVTHIAQGATAFYDLNLPVTVAKLLRGNADSSSVALIRRFQLYLSSMGGSLLEYIEKEYRLPMVRPLYRSVDATLFFPEQREPEWDLGYRSRFKEENQVLLERLLLEPAQRWSEGRFAVAGTGYPRGVRWPGNVKRIPRLPAGKRRAFYNSQRFALNVTPPGEIAVGFSPEARLFEAAACGTPVISDFWPGINTFFKPDEEILISHSPDETLVYLEEIPELERRRMGYRARERVLAAHTTRRRAAELEGYALQVLKLTAA